MVYVIRLVIVVSDVRTRGNLGADASDFPAILAMVKDGKLQPQLLIERVVGLGESLVTCRLLLLAPNDFIILTLVTRSTTTHHPTTLALSLSLALALSRSLSLSPAPPSSCSPPTCCSHTTQPLFSHSPAH